MTRSRDDALAPILRDVAACADLTVRIEHGHRWPGRTSSDDEHSTVLWTPDGSGVGIWFNDDEGLDDQPWRIADTVHEAVVEGLWSAGSSTAWPPCPWHPDTHPLQVEEQAGEIVWACPRTSDRVAQVGELTC